MKWFSFFMMVVLPTFLSGQQVDLNWQKRIRTGRSESIRALAKMDNGGYLVLSTKQIFPPDTSYLRWYHASFEPYREIRIPPRTPRFEQDELIQLASGNIGIAGSVHVGPTDTDFGWLRLDSIGQELGFRSFGGHGIDVPSRIIQSDDGSIFLAGRSNSGISGIKSEASRGRMDYWIVQIDETGKDLDQKTLGGDRDDYLANMQIRPDGSRLIWGKSNSSATGDIDPEPLGLDDGWVIQTDVDWKPLVQARTGGPANDDLSPVKCRYKDEIIFLSNEGQADAGGQQDIVLHQFNPDGATSLKVHLKANGQDGAGHMLRTCDGGYLLCATSNSTKGDDKSEDGYGGTDIWLIRMDKDFEIIWDKTIGGTLTESFPSLFRINQREYVLTFSSQSPRSGNLDEDNPDHQRGLYVIGLTDGAVPDHWIARLLKGCNICGSTMKISVGDVTRFTAAFRAVVGSGPED